MKSSFAKRTLLGLVIILNQVSAWSAVKLSVTPERGETQFLAVGNPGFLKINGKGTGPSGELILDGNQIQGELSLDLATLDTGMNLRNQHMKDKYLETAQFPKAILKISKQSLKGPWQMGQKHSGTLQSELLLHGQGRLIDVPFEISEDGQVSANFKLKITDFQIEIPSFMGVTVADTVDVKIQTHLNQAQ